MVEDLLKTIESDKANYGQKIQPPCPEASIPALKSRAKTELNAELSEEYLDFLKKTNGLDNNGLVIFASETTPISGYDDRFLEGIIEANLNLRDLESFMNYIVYGSSGESLYVFQIDKSQYKTIDAISHDSFETYDSFNLMLKGAIEENS